MAFHDGTSNDWVRVSAESVNVVYESTAPSMVVTT